MYVNTNYNSLVSRSNLFNTNNDLSKSMERLSSGLRINGASDDAAGLAIATRMTSQVRGMEQAFRNAQDGVSLIQTTEGALGTTTDMLQRMRELAVQADNGTYSASDKQSMEDEAASLTAEIDHIATTTTFNGINVLAAASTVDLHISEKSSDTITVNLVDATSANLLGGPVDFSTTASTQTAIDDIDTAITTLNTARGNLGATQNRLDFVSDSLQSNINNTSASRSRIQDADMAKEMSDLTKSQILSQTTMAMLARANSQPQGIMQLLQG
jgi:flagellin